MTGWLVTLIAIWILYVFFGNKDRSETEKWREVVVFSVLTVCITILMVWGNFK